MNHNEIALLAFYSKQNRQLRNVDDMEHLAYCIQRYQKYRTEKYQKYPQSFLEKEFLWEALYTLDDDIKKYLVPTEINDLFVEHDPSDYSKLRRLVKKEGYVKADEEIYLIPFSEIDTHGDILDVSKAVTIFNTDKVKHSIEFENEIYIFNICFKGRVYNNNTVHEKYKV